MGAILGRLFAKAQDTRVVMLGLDGAGKTTALYRLSRGETVHTIPTIGFNVERVKAKGLTMTVWDVGGQDRIRKLWHHYFDGVQALVFVVDASDHDRMGEAVNEFERVRREIAQHSRAFRTSLVYWNKTDVQGAASPDRFVGDVMVQPSVATTGQGLVEGMAWLAERLRE